MKTAADLVPIEVPPPIREAFELCRLPGVNNITIHGELSSGKTMLALLLTLDAVMTLARMEEMPFGLSEKNQLALAFITNDRGGLTSHMEGYGQWIAPYINRYSSRDIEIVAADNDTEPASLVGKNFVHAVFDNIDRWPGIDLFPYLERRIVSRTGNEYPARIITTKHSALSPEPQGMKRISNGAWVHLKRLIPS